MAGVFVRKDPQPDEYVYQRQAQTDEYGPKVECGEKMSLDQPNEPAGRDLPHPPDPIARNEKDTPNRADGRTKISRVVDVLMSDGSSNEAIQPAEVSRRGGPPSAAVVPAVPPDRTWASGTAGPAGTSMLEFLWSVLRFKWTIVLISILVSAPIIAAIWTQIVPQYQARGEIRVRPIIPRLVFRTEESGPIPFYDSFVNTQVSIIRSLTVLNRVLEQRDVQETLWYRDPPQSFKERLSGNVLPPMERLRESLSVRPRPRTEIIDLSFTDTSATDAKVIVNAVINQYIRYIGERSDETADTLYRQLTEQYRSLETEIQGRERISADLRRELGTELPQELVSSKRMRLDETRARLDDLRNRIAILEWEMQQLANDDSREATEAGSEDPDQPRYYVDAEWRKLDTDIKTIQHRMATSVIGPNHPAAVRLQKDLEFAEELRRVRETQLDELWQDRLRSTARMPMTFGEPGEVSHGESSMPLEYQLARARQEEQLLLTEVEKQQAEFKGLFDKTQALERENNALDHKRTLFSAVRQRLEEKNMERNVPGSIEVLMGAFAPSQPSQDRRVVFTVMALVCGIGMGGGTAFLRATRSQTIHAAKDIPQPLKVPFLGHVPLVTTTKLPGKSLCNELEQNQAMLIESIRVVRTALLARLSGRNGATVLVTSANEGTGKSSFTMVLGRSLARAGKKVLMIDADFHKVTLSKRFELTDQPGFVEILRDKAIGKLPIYPTATPGLDVMPGGNQIGSQTTVDEIANGAFKSCISRVRRQCHYDVILLDASPILPVADATILAGQVDGTVMVEREQVSHRAHVLTAMARLHAAGGTMLGTVFVGSLESQGYGYGYGYGYGQGKKKGS